MQPVKDISAGDSLIKPGVLTLDAIYSKHDCIDFISTLNSIEVNLFNGQYENFDSFKNDLLEINELTEQEINSIDTTIDKKLPEEYCSKPIYSSVNFRKESVMYTVHIQSYQTLHQPLYETIKNFNPTIKQTPSLHRLYIVKNEKLMLEARDNINAVFFLFFDVELNAAYDDPNMSHVNATTAVVHPLGDYHHVATNENLDGWIKVKIVQTNYINTRIPNKLAHRLFEKKEQQVRKVSLKTATDAESAKDNESTRQFMNNIMGLRGDQFEPHDIPIVNILHNSKYTPNKKKQVQSNNNKKSPIIKLLSNGKSKILSPASTTTNAISAVTTIPNLYQSAAKMLSSLSTSNRPSINYTPTEKPLMEDDSDEESAIDDTPIDKSTKDEPTVDESDIDEPDMEKPVLDEPTNEQLHVDESTAEEPIAIDEATVGEPSTEKTPIDKPPVATHWKKLEKFCNEKNGDLVPRRKYDAYISRTIDAEGYFKEVYFTPDGNDVIQIFHRSTASQRVIEIACLLALKDKDNIGRIKEIIHDDANTEVIGLTMERYQMTLKDYLRQHAHNRLTAEQRMQIIVQMLKSMQVIHQLGIAHRDLSMVNFMINVNENNESELYLIDFGKAVFMFPRDTKKWWVNADDHAALYKDDVQPSSREELAVWCRNLPYVMARPDHGYRFYRSIQTLPKNNKDRDMLPYLIDPAAEDMYSLGTMIWKVFSGIEPWPGIFDTDLKKLRETVGSDFVMDNVLDRVMPGPTSKSFLKKFLRVNPLDRESAAQILHWIQQEDVKQGLLEEWALEISRRPTAKKRAATLKPKKAIMKVEPKAEACKSGVPIGRPARRKRGFVEEAPVADEEPPRKAVGKSCRKSRSETPAPKLRRVGFEEKPIVKDQNVKQSAKSGVGRRTRSNDVIAKAEAKTKTLHNEEKSVPGKDVIVTKTEDIPKTVHDGPVPVVAKKVYPYTYVKTGKPRGRPKKIRRGVPKSNSAVANKEDPSQQLDKTEEPVQQMDMDYETTQQLDKTGEPSQQLSKVKEPHQQLANVVEQQMNKIEQPLQKITEPEGPSQQLEKSNRHIIRLPGRPKANLDKQTWELISRGIPTTVRDSPRRVSSPPSQTEPLFSPQPTTLSRPPSLSPSQQHTSTLPQTSLSRQSSQSTFFSLLSPVSNTETVDEAPSPTSPLPSCPPAPEGKKRKMVGETEQENVKRRHTDAQEEQSITQNMVANIDEFDRALYNILQNYDLHNSHE